MENKKFYVEKQKNFIGKQEVLIRPLKNGLEKMLNSYPDKKTLVEVRNLDITYGTGRKKFKAIKDVSFNIYEGEVLGLVGESGSGKSTIGSSLVGLVPHSFGSISIDGNTLPHKNSDIKGEFNDFLVQTAQMIFQDPSNSLNPNKNIYDVLSEGLDNLQRKDKNYIPRMFLLNFDEKAYSTLEQAINSHHSPSEGLKIKFKSMEEMLKEYDPITFKESFYNQLENLFLIEQHTFAKEIRQIHNLLKEREQVQKNSISEMKKHLILEMLQSVGLDKSILKRFPLEFSGGQQQRIGISRAVVLRPKLLVADEPISALDVSIQAQVVNIFNDLKEKYNLTILFIAHDLRMVEYISDRIGVMNRGTLLEIGPTKEIMENSLHPYTKSLLEAVPSIESKNGSLLGYIYDYKMHNYSDEVQPEWIDLGNNHFILATKEEVEKWKKGEY